MPTLILLGGAAFIGKSAAMLQFAATYAEGGDLFGRPVKRASGMVVYVSGEDRGKTIERLHLMLGKERTPSQLNIVSPSSAAGLVEFIEELIVNGSDVSLIIIDPISKYFVGDEKQSGPVNAFYAPLERLIEATGCAAIAMQHLKKDCNPQTVNSAYSALKGNGGFTDRPRLVLTMAYNETSGESVLGIPKCGGAPRHNGLPGEYHEDVIHLVRDPKGTMLHFLANQVPDGKGTSGIVDEAAAVLAAVERINAEGGKVTKTGKNGLKDQKPPELEGISRVRVREIVDTLIADGVLFFHNGTIVTEEGLAT